MSLKGKTVLVTGSDGFIGSHLTEHLVRIGAKVRAFTYYNSFGSLGWLEHAPADIKASIDFRAGDIRDAGSVRDAVKGCDVVLNLAALIAIPYSYKSPQSYVETNITGTLNIVDAARDFGVSKVVHTSTSEVYGTARFVPITEEHPMQGQSPYSATKIGADHVALSYHKSFGTPVGVIRPFNTYGPRQSARAVIPTIISQLLKNSGPLKLGALAPTRDFNFVSDTVRGFVAFAESDKSVGEVINIGSGFEVSIEDTAKIIGEVLGKPVAFETDAQRLRPENSEVERLLACNKKAKALLGWEPEFAGRDGFKRGIALTAEWFKNPENLKAYKADIYNV
ncbi:MAG: NAD-dependent 4,6-dehydratase LegB [Alphaproteobacteria bacterium]|nr:NAD-dependent 4,6-dehydratase LegB [Alphaproteobacteria bacterium]